MNKMVEIMTRRLNTINDLSKRNYYFLLTVIAVNTILLVVFPSNISFILFLLSALLLFCFSPFTSLIYWIFLLPFENYLRQQDMISPYFTLFFFILIYIVASTYEKKFKILWLSALFGIVMIVVSSFSLFYVDNIFVSVRNIMSLSTVIIVFYAITLFMKQSEKSLFYINGTLFLSAAYAMIFSIMTTSRGYRFSLFTNVRSISNILGISIIFGSLYLYRKMISNDSEVKFKLSNAQNISIITYIFIMSVFLLFTVSRGVVLAVVITLFIFFAFVVIPNFSIKTLKKVLLYSGILAIFIYVLSLLPIFNIIGWDTIILRFSQNLSENVRLEFWFYALKKLAESHLLFGIGLANFENFILEGGYSFYSHSVFIDLIVSTGLVGFVSIAILSLKLFVDIIRERNLPSFSILIFTLISFSTHGTVFSKFFWLSMALIIGYPKSNAK